METTATTAYFHVAPVVQRASIRQHGLDHARGRSRWLDAPVGFNSFPKGNYLFTDRASAEAYRIPGQDFDIWQVDGTHLSVDVDPLRTPNAVVSYAPVPAAALRL